ncbi:MAG: hypothetical protein P0S95_05605 [Rhabdochlamydiaceae bacterium]|nr:hypothetical protein [Candidatus Amphrikana amoebophyrae]
MAKVEGSAAPNFEYPAEDYNEVSEVRDRAEIIKGPWKGSAEPITGRATDQVPKPKRVTPDWVRGMISGMGNIGG